MVIMVMNISTMKTVRKGKRRRMVLMIITLIKRFSVPNNSNTYRIVTFVITIIGTMLKLLLLDNSNINVSEISDIVYRKVIMLRTMILLMILMMIIKRW